MLFNSPAFIFAFLPLVTAVFYFLGVRGKGRLAMVWLTAASLFFYAWWNPVYVGLLLASIGLNYLLGARIADAVDRRDTRTARRLLALAITIDLFLLGYFKYSNFFLLSANQLLGSALPIEAITLPLGISFFTFTQIAFLVDVYRGKVTERNFLHYALFVTYFPHLIAGPVLHHKEMMPQFASRRIFDFRPRLFAVGLSVFGIGLFKKVIVADTLALYATPVFSAAASGGADITFFSAWGGAIAYALQLYYDFSGYSDMAIGISLLFGIRLPLNFYSPYKAVNVIDFWRRWHMTLSRFLRDYLYIPLGGNRRGKVRRYINLMVTMLLGGLWHGAGWTFVVWGALHGAYLVVNHAWQAVRNAVSLETRPFLSLGSWSGRVTTFLAVTVAWVVFRAESLEAAASVLNGMAGFNGVVVPGKLLAILNSFGGLGARMEALGVKFIADPIFDQWGYPLVLAALAFTWYSPNTHQFMARYRPALVGFDAHPPVRQRIQWRLNRVSAAFCALLTVLAFLGLSHVSEFLYFQF